MRDDTFYTVLIEGTAESENFVQVFFAWASTLGEAIGKVIAVAIEEEHIDNALPSEADTYDYNTLPDEIFEIGDSSVYTSGARIFFPPMNQFLEFLLELSSPVLKESLIQRNCLQAFEDIRTGSCIASTVPFPTANWKKRSTHLSMFCLISGYHGLSAQTNGTMWRHASFTPMKS